MSFGSRPLCNILKLQFSSKLKVGERKNLLSALRTFATSSTRASDTPQDQSKLGKQLKSRAEASIRRIVDKVTKEAKARMEGKAGGEGQTKRVSKEELLHPFSTKKTDGERSDLEKVIIALLVFGLVGIGVLIYRKSTNASEKDD